MSEPSPVSGGLRSCGGSIGTPGGWRLGLGSERKRSPIGWRLGAGCWGSERKWTLEVKSPNSEIDGTVQFGRGAKQRFYLQPPAPSLQSLRFPVRYRSRHTARRRSRVALGLWPRSGAAADERGHVVSACSDCFAPGSLTGLGWSLRMESCQVRHRQLAQNRTHQIVNQTRIGIAIFIASPLLGGLCLRLAWRQVRRRRFAHLSTAGHYVCVMIGLLCTALYQQDRERATQERYRERDATPPLRGRVRELRGLAASVFALA